MARMNSGFKLPSIQLAAAAPDCTAYQLEWYVAKPPMLYPLPGIGQLTLNQSIEVAFDDVRHGLLVVHASAYQDHPRWMVETPTRNHGWVAYMIAWLCT